MKIGPPITPGPEDLVERTTSADQASAELSQNTPDMAIGEGNGVIRTNKPGTSFAMSVIKALDVVPISLENKQPGISFTLSDIKILEEAPTALENSETADTLEEDLFVAEYDTEESWIPVP
jgi:hypothetical protein